MIDGERLKVKVCNRSEHPRKIFFLGYVMIKKTFLKMQEFDRLLERAQVRIQRRERW